MGNTVTIKFNISDQISDVTIERIILFACHNVCFIGSYE